MSRVVGGMAAAVAGFAVLWLLDSAGFIEEPYRHGRLLQDDGEDRPFTPSDVERRGRDTP